jgi:hypothetical protein
MYVGYPVFALYDGRPTAAYLISLVNLILHTM